MFNQPMIHNTSQTSTVTQSTLPPNNLYLCWLLIAMGCFKLSANRTMMYEIGLIDQVRIADAVLKILRQSHRVAQVFLHDHACNGSCSDASVARVFYKNSDRNLRV